LTAISVEFNEVTVGVDFTESAPLNVAFDTSTPVNVDFGNDPVTVSFSESTPVTVEFDGVSRKTWESLVMTWTETPTLHATIAAGRVFLYTYGSTIRYRLVPAPYDSTLDQFFTTFVDPTLSGLVATRGASI